METKINWETEFDQALAQSRTKKKPILLDFFNPQWIGCQQMDAVTYPTEAVIEFLNDVVIPLKISSELQPAASDFNIQWTPALLVLDQEGMEHHRTIGFLSPEELIPSILLGLGNMCFHKDDFEGALNYYNKILAEHLGSDAVPEAIFQIGVSRYKSTNDPKPLKEAYEDLQRDFPANTWTKRAYPYRLIQ